ncbi:MAG: PadR family transcriptional regulator [Pseudomonadota bacterium]
MALAHAILVSLIERPATGYELAQRFDRSIGYFWHATHQQIYRELARMEQDGWVSVEVVEHAGRLDKKVYTVRAAGRKALAAWLREPSEPAGIREDLLVKLRAAAAVGDTAGLAAEIRRHRELHAQRLELYREYEKRNFPKRTRREPAQTLQHLVLRSGIVYESGWLAWCDEALAALADTE